jgi:PAS domain S-box-containing protein
LRRLDCNADRERDNDVKALPRLERPFPAWKFAMPSNPQSSGPRSSSARQLTFQSTQSQPSTADRVDISQRIDTPEDPKRALLRMERHSRILEHLVRGDSLEKVLKLLVELAEETRQGMVGSIMLVDSLTQQLRHGASVSLPLEYIEAIDGLQIGPSIGSCGIAAFSGERVIVADVQTHPDWTDYHAIVREAGLRACWSEPIVSGQGVLLGTFAMYFREPRRPEPSDLEFVSECATLSALAIERHRDEQRIRQTAAIVNSSEDAILSKDLNGIIQSWNPAAERIYGYSADEVIGRSITILVPEDRLGELNAYLARLKDGERIEHFETVRMAKDGTRVDVILTLSPVHDADGQIVQFVDVQKNITSSKRVKTDLQETRRQHSMLLSNLLGAAFRRRNDKDCSVEVISDGIESVLGYTPAQLISKEVEWLSTVEPSDREHLRSEMKRAFDEKRSYQSEFRIRHRDGSTRWVWEQGRGIYDEDGKVIAFEGYVTDITSRKIADVAIRDREQRYRSVIETANSVIMCVSLDREITEWNAEAERVFGYARDDAMGKNPFELLVTADRREEAIAHAEQVSSGTSLRAYELDCVNRDGSIRTMLWNANQLLDGDNRPIGYITVGLDITELQIVQDKLIQSERLAALGQMISVIAHESRNALQRIQIGADMLGFEMAEDSDSWKDLQRILRAKEDLQRMYEELRSYAAPVKLECDICSVAQIWRQAWASLESVRQGRAARLVEHQEVGIESIGEPCGESDDRKTNSTSLDCEVDAFRLEQVFRNLFENSLAACEDPVEISIRCHATSIEGTPALAVQVCDNGPGLSSDEKSHVFDAFFTTKQKGTGLGMAIAHRLLSVHFGTITTGDGESGGACFELSIPRKQP